MCSYKISIMGTFDTKFLDTINKSKTQDCKWNLSPTTSGLNFQEKTLGQLAPKFSDLVASRSILVTKLCIFKLLRIAQEEHHFKGYMCENKKCSLVFDIHSTHSMNKNLKKLN